jgi:hypothetical protein
MSVQQVSPTRWGANTKLHEDLSGKQYNAFGGGVQCGNGDLLAAYGNATHHLALDQYSYYLRSTNEGATWGSPVEITQLRSDSNYGWLDLGLAKVEGGSHDNRLVLSATRVSKTTLEYTAWTLYSDDNGFTWSNPVQVPFSFTATNPNTSLPGSAWGTDVSGPPVCIPDGSGTLLLAAYGGDGASTIGYSRLARSTNGGVSWTDIGVIAQDATTERVEPNLCVYTRSDNSRIIICMMRSDTVSPFRFFRAISTDDGSTWTPDASSCLTSASGRPALTQLAPGLLGMAYRSASSGLPTMAFSFTEGASGGWTTENIGTGNMGSFVYGEWVRYTSTRGHRGSGLVFCVEDNAVAAQSYSSAYYSGGPFTLRPKSDVYATRVTAPPNSFGDSTIKLSSKPGTCGPWVAPNGATYVAAYRDVSGSRSVRVYKAADPMQGTWSAVNTSGERTVTTAGTTIDAVDTKIVGSILHVAYAQSDNVIRYARFDTSSDTWTLDEDSGISSLNTGVGVYLGVRSNGDSIIAYGKTATGNWRTYYAKRTNSGTWTRDVLVAQEVAGQADALVVGIAIDNSDRAYFFVEKATAGGSADGLYYRVLSAADSFIAADARISGTGPQSIDGPNNFYAALDMATPVMYADSSSVIRMRAAYRRRASGTSTTSAGNTNVLEWAPADSPTFTIRSNVGSAGDSYADTTLANLANAEVNGARDTEVVVHISDSDRDLRIYSGTPGVGSFSNALGLGSAAHAGTFNRINVTNGTRSNEVLIPYVYSDSNGIYYNQIDVAQSTSTLYMTAISSAETFGVATIQRAYSLAITETAALSESLSRSVGDSRSLSDSLALGDAVVRAFPRSLDESVVVADVTASGVVLPRPASESLSVADTLLGLLSLGRTATTSVFLSDAAGSLIADSRALAETAALADALSGAVSIVRSVNGSIVVVDNVAGTSGGVFSVSEVNVLVDSLVFHQSLARVLAQSFVLSDAIIISGPVVIAYVHHEPPLSGHVFPAVASGHVIPYVASGEVIDLLAGS